MQWVVSGAFLSLKLGIAAVQKLKVQSSPISDRELREQHWASQEERKKFDRQLDF